MRFAIDPAFHAQMKARTDHTADCYVRPGEYLHHLYLNGVKYVVVPAVEEAVREAEARKDAEALRHLRIHQKQYQAVIKALQKEGRAAPMTYGDPPPEGREAPAADGRAPFEPPTPKNLDETGLTLPFIGDLVLRAIYNRGQLSGAEIAGELKLPFPIVNQAITAMRKQGLIDQVGQRPGVGDAALVFEIKPPKGAAAIQDALNKSEYVGPAPVPFDAYVRTVREQTVRNLVVTRRTIQKAFQDLIITDSVFSEIGPAINSAASIFLFGFPGNGKTSIAERITRLMGDTIFVPHAVEVNGQIIKVFDPIVHQPVEDAPAAAEPPPAAKPLSPTLSLLEKQPERSAQVFSRLSGPAYDRRYVRIKRPTIVVGGELTLPMLDLKYNAIGKFYEAPYQMKANGGIFMIDDFGRQQMRPMDLLNRWIVPLEKRYDYLTTVTGTKLEVPFDVLLLFSTNLDPNQLVDEAFLRRIKFKIEIKDPTEDQFRKIWRMVCQLRDVEYDEEGLDYLIAKWYRPQNRPFRMCHPRDILDQMINIAKYNMIPASFEPDLIDAGCATYFVSLEKKDYGAKVRLD